MRLLEVDGKGRLVFFAKNDLRCGEELTYDYRCAPLAPPTTCPRQHSAALKSRHTVHVSTHRAAKATIRHPSASASEIAFTLHSSTRGTLHSKTCHRCGAHGVVSLMNLCAA